MMRAVAGAGVLVIALAALSFGADEASFLAKVALLLAGVG
jgi:hypothetical protein